jgi:hypothetical protein
MLDTDYCCDKCIKEAVERRFIFYPNHEMARVTQLAKDSKGTCSICKGNIAKYAVSIVIGSLRRDLLDRIAKE